MPYVAPSKRERMGSYGCLSLSAKFGSTAIYWASTMPISSENLESYGSVQTCRCRHSVTWCKAFFRILRQGAGVGWQLSVFFLFSAIACTHWWNIDWIIVYSIPPVKSNHDKAGATGDVFVHHVVRHGDIRRDQNSSSDISRSSSSAQYFDVAEIPRGSEQFFVSMGTASAQSGKSH